MRVRRDALRRNFARIAEKVGPRGRILPMVKANAYGLGARSVVESLTPLDPWGFGVATVDEGMELREFGVTRPIVICAPVPPDDLGRALEADLQVSVSSLRALRAVEEAARRAGRVAEVHVEVDTGMGRSGFDWRRVGEWLPHLTRRSPYRIWTGCFTHLHSADEDGDSVDRQWERFSGVLSRARIASPDLLVHVLNSAGLFLRPELGEGVSRPGIFLYGGRVGRDQPAPEPVVSLHARVVHVRDAPSGTTLGYGSTYAASGEERWATLSIGYGDGLPRALGNRGFAIVAGARVPIIGRISMDVTVVDITGVSAVEEGVVATLIGSQGSDAITLDDVAELAGTISYEVLTGLTPRLPRIWSDDERPASTHRNDKGMRSS